MTTWQILIPTVEERTKLFAELMADLAPQLEQAGGQVEVLVARDNLEASIGEKRNRLVDAATATYVSHLDDDDLVAADYIAAILSHLDGAVDYVSYDIEANGGGYDRFVVSHSLRHEPRWERTCRYVDIGHLMPMRLELHRLGRFGDTWGDDQPWAEQVRQTGRLRTEHHIDRTLYNYRVSDGALWNPERRGAATTTPNPCYPHVRYL